MPRAVASQSCRGRVGLIGAFEVASRREYADDLLTLVLKDGRRVHLLARGHMFNLAGPRPLGNSIESMDLGFALQARCLEAVASRRVDATSCVVPVPDTSTRPPPPAISTASTPLSDD